MLSINPILCAEQTATNWYTGSTLTSRYLTSPYAMAPRTMQSLQSSRRHPASVLLVPARLLNRSAPFNVDRFNLIGTSYLPWGLSFLGTTIAVGSTCSTGDLTDLSFASLPDYRLGSTTLRVTFYSTHSVSGVVT